MKFLITFNRIFLVLHVLSIYIFAQLAIDGEQNWAWLVIAGSLLYLLFHGMLTKVIDPITEKEERPDWLDKPVSEWPDPDLPEKMKHKLEDNGWTFDD